MFRFVVFLFCLLLTLDGCSPLETQISQNETGRLNIKTSITPSGNNLWSVKYELSETVTELAFARSRGDYRTSTWSFPDEDFLIKRLGDLDIVSRLDAQPFREFSAQLSPFRENISKEYLLFGRFTNGAERVYAGQFRMLETDGSGEPIYNGLIQTLTFNPGNYGRFYADNTWHKTSYTVQSESDHEDGYIIFGDTPITKFEGGSIMLDPGTPDWIRDGILDVTPIVSEYFENRLGSVSGPQTLTLITYSPDDHPGISIEGGVLANQVHFHLSGRGLSQENPKVVQHIAWTSAHETAHMWNSFGEFSPDYFYKDDDPDTPEPKNAQWLHEGGAEMLTYKAMKDTKSASLDYLESRLQGFYSECVTALGHGPLNQAEDRGSFQDYYACGAVIGMLTEIACKTADKDYVDVWRSMTDDLNGDNYSQKKYLNAVSECDDAASAVDAIRQIAEETISNPAKFLKTQFNNFNVQVKEIEDGVKFLPAFTSSGT